MNALLWRSVVTRLLFDLQVVLSHCNMQKYTIWHFFTLQSAIIRAYSIHTSGKKQLKHTWQLNKNSLIF